MANIIVVDKNLDFVLCGCFGWGGRKVYVAEKYMAELTAQFNVSHLLQADFYPDVCKQALNSVFTQRYLSQCSTVADLYLRFLQRAETRITCICLHIVYRRTFQRTRPASPWLDCAGRIVSIFCGKSGGFSCIAYHSKKKTGKDRLICCC